MTKFRTIHGRRGLVAEQTGAWGVPTEWRIKCGDDVLCRVDSQVQARLLLNVLGRVVADDWLVARRDALAELEGE